MTHKKSFDLFVLDSDPPLEPLKVILPRDGTEGMVIGVDHEVRELYNLIKAYLETGKHSGEIQDYHEQLGAAWLTVEEAVDLSAKLGQDIPVRTVRWAAAHNFILGAQKSGRDWRFPKRTFLHWLKNRPKPGPKHNEEVDNESANPK